MNNLEKINMIKNKPLPMVITAALLVALIVLIAVFQLSSFTQPAMRQGPTPLDAPAGEWAEGGFPPEEGSAPPQGSPGFEGGERPDVPREGFSGGDPGQRLGFSGEETMFKVMQFLRGVQTGWTILIVLLGILSLTGILLGRDWGRVWAIITASLTLVHVVAALFFRQLGGNWIEIALRLILAAAILVLSVLPKSGRRSTAQGIV